VAWSDLARRLEAIALSGPGECDRIPLNSCYFLPCHGAEEALALGAWLNSTWCRAAARARATPARGGFARFDARTIGGLPVVVTALRDPALVALARQGAGGSDIQGALDEVCAAHLALTSNARDALLRLANAAPHRG
jgi:hypothetical protein